jgi:hypothetical protein
LPFYLVEGAPSDAFISSANFTLYENYAHFLLLTAKMLRKIELFPRVTACCLLSTLKLLSSRRPKCGVAAIIVSVATKVDCRWAPGAVGVWMNNGKCLQSNEMTFITTLPTKEIGASSNN